MDNTNEIKKFMAEKIAENIPLSDIQSMVNEKFNTRMTFMDIRIMASELEVDWQKQEKVEEPVKVEEAKPAEEADAEKAPAKTTVELNKIVRPGAIASGTVNFASGVYAEWYIDNSGRLGLDKVVGGKPTEQDIEDFQVEMQKIFAER